jgi:hypothetical protein
MNKIASNSERGSARLKFIIAIAIIGIVTYAGYLYIPVAYQAYLFKDVMQQKVDAALVLSHDGKWIKDQLVKAAPEYDVPADAIILPTQAGNRVEVTVQFTRPIEFPGYTYNYNFDHTARSTDFLSTK